MARQDVDQAERVATVMRLHDEGLNAHDIAERLGIQVNGLRKWLRVHGCGDVLAAIAVAVGDGSARERADAARAARIARCGLSAVEVFTVAEAAMLVRCGESPWFVSLRLGRSACTIERYAEVVAAVIDSVGGDSVGVSAAECRLVRGVFGAEAAWQAAFRRGRLSGVAAS